jgi:P-type Cu+ transporter
MATVLALSPQTIENRHVEMAILGMTCAACVRHVEKAASAVDGVAHVDVNLLLSRATIELQSDADRDKSIAAVKHAVQRAGYETMEAEAQSAATEINSIPDDFSDHNEVRRVVIAGACALPILVVAMSHGRLIASPIIDGLVQAVLATIALLVVGRPYLRATWNALRRRTADMNVLIGLGTASSYGYSLALLVDYLTGDHAGHHALHVYFEAAPTIMFFVAVGKWLDARARHQVAFGVMQLAAQLRGNALRVRHADGSTVVSQGEECNADQLQPGDEIMCRPGQRVPADGTVIDGESEVDEALLTGEVTPVRKSAGSAVYAGTINQLGNLTVRVARAAQSSTIGRIATAVLQAQRDKAPIANLADRISAVFVPVVLVIAVVTALTWGFVVGSWSQAMTHAVSVMVIACPCALGIATPAAIAVATSRAAALGLLFKNAAVIESAARIDTVVFDKTGTLTNGVRTVIAVEVLSSEISIEQALAIASALEQGSEHSVAKAICDYAASRAITPANAHNRQVLVGSGVRAKIAGAEFAIGDASIFAPNVVDIPASLLPHVSTATIVWLGTTTPIANLIAAFAVGDTIAADAPSVCAALRSTNIATVMASGDAAAVCTTVATAVGITAPFIHSRCTPSSKADLVTSYRAAGKHVAMVGDGLNDAPALAAADLGVVVEHGTDFAAAAADLRIVRGGLSSLLTAFALSRATMRIIVGNLVWAFAFNVVGIALAAGVFATWTTWQLTPIFASVAMSTSSVLVLANSLRLRKWQHP